MINATRPAVTAGLFLLASMTAFGQSAPSGLIGCLDGNGSLYNLAPKGQLTEKCSGSDLQVFLGSGTINGINVGAGLTGGGNEGTVEVAIDPQFSVPPVCPPGQVPLSDSEGGWVCTPPNLLHNPNPGATVWVVPVFENRAGRDDVFFVNPGVKPARTICHFFTGNGTFIRIWSHEQEVPVLGQKSCFGRPGPATPVATWLLLVSDVPVLPTVGKYSGNRYAVQVEAHSVNCKHPEGYEFICEYAID